jgi:hypothetical protein
MAFRLRQIDLDDKICQKISLEMFAHLIPQERVCHLITACRLPEKRERKLNLCSMVYYVIALSLFPRLSQEQVFARLAQGLRYVWPDDTLAMPSKGALGYRCKQLGVTVLRLLFRQTCHPLATPETPGAFWRGQRLMAIDGTVQDVAASEANIQHFGYSCQGASRSCFPQVRCLYLAECGTHAMVDAVPAPSHVSERALIEPLLRSVHQGMLVLVDRGIFSGALFHGLQTKQAHGLMRLEENMLTRPARRLPDGSYLSWLTPTSGATRRPLLLRVIEYWIDAPLLPGHGTQVRLVTDLLSPSQAPVQELIALYHERWEIEECIDEQKNHLRLSLTPLRSKTPEGVLQELYGLLLLHYGIRSLMAQAAEHEHLDPDRLSFRDAVVLVEQSLTEFAQTDPEQWARLRQRLLTALASHRLPPRRQRFQARVVKRFYNKFHHKRKSPASDFVHLRDHERLRFHVGRL